MKRIAVMTSGGDAPGMNAAIRAVVRAGIDKDMEVFGINRGYEGLMEGDVVRLYRKDVGDILDTGGTKLGTARSELYRTPEGQDKAAAVLKKFEIEGIVIIGGNGSLTGALKLVERGITVMGLPGTIDNDLNYTDFTIGFDTAVSTVLDAISKIRDTSSAHNRNAVIEVMGRDCGDIALYAGLAGGAEAVLIPEVDYDMDFICNKITEGMGRQKKHSIIIKAEGSKGTTAEVTKEINDRTGSDTKMVNLSYLQRGGNPTGQDIMLATRTGAKAVELLAAGSESMAIGIVDNKIAAFPLAEALEMPKRFDVWEFLDLINMLSK